MKDISAKSAIFGVSAATITMLAASVSTTAAMPIATTLSQGVVAPLLDAQYYGYRHRAYRPYYRGRAGVYSCGPYSLKTHLSRKNCR